MAIRNIFHLFFITTLFIGCTVKQKQDPIQDIQYTLHEEIPEQQLVPESRTSILQDTTIYIYCDIDGDEQIDTISTRVSFDTDTLYIGYVWIRNNEKIWFENLNYLSETDYSSIKLSIEELLPEIYQIVDFQNILDLCIDFGIGDLKKKGHLFDEEGFKNYIKHYKGKLIAWGHPENREGLFIWYEPLKVFVLFYQP